MTSRCRGRLAAMVLAGSLAVAACGGGGEEGPAIEPIAADAVADFDYTIPPGTAMKIAAGQFVELMPATLEATVGQTLRIRNLDNEPQTVGPFFVRPGETLTYRFSSPGRIEGACALQPSGVFVVEVSEA